MYFPWTVCDYPLAQAVEDRIVKAPLIVTKEDDPSSRRTRTASPRTTSVEKYGYWLTRGGAALEGAPASLQAARYPAGALHHGREERLRRRDRRVPVDDKEFGFVRTTRFSSSTPTGLARSQKADLDEAREAARDIDKAESQVKAIVSVMMLREGWDVRNVTVVLGLRPFTAKAEILPEQVVGSRSAADDPGRARTARRRSRCSAPATSQRASYAARSRRRRRRHDDQDRSAARRHHRARARGAAGLRHRDPAYTKPSLVARHPHRRFRPEGRPLVCRSTSRRTTRRAFRVKLRLEFATTETEVRQADIERRRPLPPQELLASDREQGHRAGEAAEPASSPSCIRRCGDYVATRCFGKAVDLDDERATLPSLSELELPGGHRQVPRPARSPS